LAQTLEVFFSQQGLTAAADIARELGTSKQNVSLVIRQTGFSYAYANTPGKRVSNPCANPACQNRIETYARRAEENSDLARRSAESAEVSAMDALELAQR
jgi:hypothetical protein